LFATKVIDRRGRKQSHFPAERRMLCSSESDPEFNADPTRVEPVAPEMAGEAQIAKLLRNALAADSATDSRATCGNRQGQRAVGTKSVVRRRDGPV
jgi:hypothetical protein